MRANILFLAALFSLTCACSERKAQTRTAPSPAVRESPPVEAACPTGGADTAYLLQVSPSKSGVPGAFRVDYTMADGSKGFFAGPFVTHPTTKAVRGLAQIDSVSLSDSSNEVKSLTPLKIKNGFGCQIKVDRGA